MPARRQTMPHPLMKGIYSQGFVVLTDRFVEIDELRALFPEFPFVRTIPAGERWEMGGATAVIDYRPEANGRVLIDTVPHPWPDHMGNTKDEAMLFGAWSMGHFGPFAYPHGLKRAVQQAWSWPEAKEMVPQHRGFIRLRSSYCLGAGPEARVGTRLRGTAGAETGPPQRKRRPEGRR